MNNTSLIMIIVGSALVNNVVLNQFLGICSFLGVSKQMKASISLGGAVIFVITIALTIAGAIRELLGAGTVFGLRLLPESFGMTIFIQPPGAFLVFALIIAVMNAIGIKTRQRKLVESGCDGNCSLCQAVCETRDAGPAAKAEEKGGTDA